MENVEKVEGKMMGKGVKRKYVKFHEELKMIRHETG